jgi:uncharacterized protein (DUF486 family)
LKGLQSIGLLILSNAFMTLAWYGHLRFNKLKCLESWGLLGIILISWGIALFEYILQVPANRIGFKEHGGPFNLIQLKVIQEVISLSVFVIFSVLAFKNESFKWNHIAAFILIVVAVYLVFKK